MKDTLEFIDEQLLIEKIQEFLPILIPEQETNGYEEVPIDEKLKSVCQELLAKGYLYQKAKPKHYALAKARQAEINSRISITSFGLRFDDVRGIAFLDHTPAFSKEESDEWNHPLVRKHRLNPEQTLLLAILRQKFLAYEEEYGPGQGACEVLISELRVEVSLYLGEKGSDLMDEKRLRGLLDSLKSLGIIEEAENSVLVPTL